MEFIIRGNGNFDDIKAFSFDIDGVKVFTSKIVKDTTLLKKGYTGVWSQKFAFVGSEDFNIHIPDIEYFSLKDKLKKTLHVESLNIEVSKGYVKKELLDDVRTDFKIDYTYLYYVLFFIAGFLISKIKFKKNEKELSKTDDLIKKVSICKNVDEVMFLLLLNNTNKYKDIIKQIENKELTSVKSILNLL